MELKRESVFLAAASLSACSLLIDTSGLGDAPPSGDAGQVANPDVAAIDASVDAPRDARPSIEGGVTLANGHQYAVIAHPEGILWAAAKAEAEAKGGHLATVTTPEEQTLVTSLAKGAADQLPWLGGMQPSGSAEPDGGWVWVAGEPMLFSGWSPGQPNNAGNEDAMICDTMGWRDTESNSPQTSYILEIE